MRAQIRVSLLVLFFGWVTTAYAGTTRKPRYWQPTPPTTLSASASESKFMGVLDLRPTYNEGSDSWTGEYEAEFGVQATPANRFSYVQDFGNALSPDASVSKVKLADGFLRLRFGDLVSSPRLGTKFGYEARIYAPTDSTKADRGMVTAVRNTFMFSKKASDAFTWFAWEVPILHLYSQSGFEIPGTKEGDAPSFQANPLFENRVYVGGAFSWGNGAASLTVPLVFIQTRFAAFQESAKFDDDWQHAAVFSPEFLVKVATGVQIGASYETGNLIQPDFSGYDAGGWKAGKVQGVLRVGF